MIVVDTNVLSEEMKAVPATAVHVWFIRQNSADLFNVTFGKNLFFIGDSFSLASISNVTTRPGTVPEPGSLALLGLGIVGVATLRRRHRSGLLLAA